MSEKLRILYLDDEQSYLDDAATSFSKHGFNIKTTKSLYTAKKEILSNDYNIIICDLILDDINGDSKIKGIDILRDLRQSDDGTFLALYTAFQDHLTSEEIKELENENINIYDKNEIEEIVLNIENDFKKFKEDILQDNQFYFSITSTLRKQVLFHLKNNSDKNTPIPVFDSLLLPKELSKEVRENTKIGKQYIKDWLNTMIKILDLNDSKNEKTTKQKNSFTFWRKRK